MAKSTKHKKAIKKEKTKIKLKLGKGKNLPKGVNVTNTQFQTRKIILPDQKKPEDDGKGVKYNIKKSLKSLEFNSVYVRQDGINELKRAAEENVNIFDNCLEDVFSGVSKLFVDVDINLRKDAIKLVKKILSQKTAGEVAPFFDLLAAMLSCAMNNINQGVKQDSVLILDAYLETVPSLVKYHARKILADFVDQISRKSSQANAGRVLVVNPISKLTTLKWRTSILKRIEKLISIMNEKQVYSKDQPDRTLEFPAILDRPLCNTRLLNCDTSLNLNLKIGDWRRDESEKTQVFGSSLIPLLAETWVEAAPDEKQSDEIEGNQLTSDTLEVLQSVIAVLIALSTCEGSQSTQRITSSPEYGKLLVRLMDGFPYTVVGVSKRGKPVSGSCLQENLELLCLSINAKIPLFNASGNFLGYIEDLLEHGKLTVADSQKLLEIVNRLLADPSCSDTLLERFLPSLIKFLRRANERNQVFDQALQVLIDVSVVNFRRMSRVDVCWIDSRLIFVDGEQFFSASSRISVFNEWLARDITSLPLDVYIVLKALDVFTRNAFLGMKTLKDVASRLTDRLENVAVNADSWPYRLAIQIVGNAAVQLARNGDVVTAQKCCESLSKCSIEKNYCTGLRILGESEIEARNDVQVDFWPYVV